MGYYDLRLPETLEQQAALASSYGISGFCFYYYWFNGRKLLERPLEQMLRSGKPDFPFCICWANENWTRTWDGAESEILVQQDYSDNACERFIRDVIPILKDPRYTVFTTQDVLASPLRRVLLRELLATNRISGIDVARVVKKLAQRAGLDPTAFAGHSLRAGHATSAAIAGATERSIMRQTGHRSVQMVRRYIRDGSLFRENSAGRLGL